METHVVAVSLRRVREWRRKEARDRDKHTISRMQMIISRLKQEVNEWRYWYSHVAPWECPANQGHWQQQLKQQDCPDRFSVDQHGDNGHQQHQQQEPKSTGIDYTKWDHLLCTSDEEEEEEEEVEEESEDGWPGETEIEDEEEPEYYDKFVLHEYADMFESDDVEYGDEVAEDEDKDRKEEEQENEKDDKEEARRTEASAELEDVKDASAKLSLDGEENRRKCLKFLNDANRRVQISFEAAIAKTQVEAVRSALAAQQDHSMMQHETYEKMMRLLPATELQPSGATKLMNLIAQLSEEQVNHLRGIG